MNDASFEKVSQSNKPLYGPRKLLLCGFSQSVQPKFSELVQLLGLSDIPRVWIIEDQAGISVGDLMQLEDNSGWGVSSELPRAIIMAGITQNELHRLMVGCRKAEMKPPLWATLTTTSETWAIEALLKELAAEHRAMQNKKRAE
ncbi:MAG: DUF3783 domain-containing protein [Desulfobacterales bacterium]|nr:DUF3783 domain-containing protein [Desulfobacterales bacterium]